MRLSYLEELEAESIHIIREVVAEAKNPVMLYSVGKDSGVMVRLAQKAFAPSPVPFPLLHVDTSYKFQNMYNFRDKFCSEQKLNLMIYRNEEAIAKQTNPFDLGADKCCSLLKTKALIDAIRFYEFDMAFGGARREEEKSRAKERVFSVRDKHSQWNPKLQRPELWNLYNTELAEGETMRVFPLSNWTELDVWTYVKQENLPVVPLYFSQNRDVLHLEGNENIVFPVEFFNDFLHNKLMNKYNNDQLKLKKNVPCRFRSLGCIPCTGAIVSNAKTIDDIIKELNMAKRSERENRLIDLTSEVSMETKKKEGYF